MNEGYEKFGKLFINSLFDKVDFDNIESIYVYDTGLSKATTKYFLNFPKVQIVDAGFSAPSDKIHDDGWKKNTYSKTRFLRDVLKNTHTPTIMIDVDCVFKCDFFDMIDDDADIVVCRRHRRGFSNHLGSFFVANSITPSIKFLDKWIERIESSEGKHKESPALSHILESEESTRVQELPESVISALHDSSDVKIFHLKSDAGLETVEKRIKQRHLIPYIYSYFGELAYDII